MSCDEDVCVPPGKICDGTAECANNFDEAPGICNNYGVCHGRCLSEAGTPTDRWSSVGCGVCCAFDLNGDGLLTLEEMLGFRKAMCGQDEEDCTAELVKDFATYNDIPYCGGEAAARVLFISNLVDDLEPGTVSTEDTTASWAEITGGLYPPDTMTSTVYLVDLQNIATEQADGNIPISRCWSYYDNTVRQNVYNESCQIDVSPPGLPLKFGSS